MTNVFDFMEVWHFDENFASIVKDIIEKLNPKRFIETGTYHAETIRWIANRFPNLPIYSTELSDKNYEIAIAKCKDYSSIKLYQVDSPKFLRALYDEFKNDLNIFWLDAHGNEDSSAPLPTRLECEVLKSLDRYIIMIDDFNTKDPYFPGNGHKHDGGVTDRKNFNLGLDYVSDILGPKCLVPNYKPKEFNRGYGIFIKGIEYTNPLLKEEIQNE